MLDEYAYKQAKMLAQLDPPFYALIAAAMMKADSENFTKLTRAWPEVFADLDYFYNKPGGLD
jgi:hypothetical protein